MNSNSWQHGAKKSEEKRLPRRVGTRSLRTSMGISIEEAKFSNQKAMGDYPHPLPPGSILSWRYPNLDFRHDLPIPVKIPKITWKKVKWLVKRRNVSLVFENKENRVWWICNRSLPKKASSSASWTSNYIHRRRWWSSRRILYNSWVWEHPC